MSGPSVSSFSMAVDRSVSYILRTLLNSLGLDEDHRQRRMKCQLMKQLFLSISTNPHKIPLLGGSSFETTAIDSLTSHVSTMLVRNCKCNRIISDISAWIGDEVFTYLIDSTGCPRGFVKLCLLSPIYPEYVFADAWPNAAELRQHSVDSNGRVLLINRLTRVYTISTNNMFELHGPALYFPSKGRHLDQYLVPTLRCDSFPKEAAGWKQRQTSLTRTRIDPAIIDDINHCYLVAAGYKYSPTEHLEWRLSFSHIENKLVHGWNNVQYQCYVLLKFIQKDLIKPFVLDSLCSYHYKTLMMWINEEYPREFFTESNLEHCILTCLRNLSESLRKRYLPHYFVNGRNLYYPKITNNIDNSKKLLDVIENVMETWPRCLFTISTCRLGMMFQSCFTSHLQYQNIYTDCVTQVRERRQHGKHVFELTQELYCVFKEYLDMRDRVMTESESVVSDLSEICHVARESNYNIENRRFINFAMEDLLCNIGLQWIHCTGSNKEVFRSVTAGSRCIRMHGNSCCIDTGLKIATHWLMSRNYRQASACLARMEDQIRSYTASMCCHIGCSGCRYHVLATFNNKPSILDYFKHYNGTAVTYRIQDLSRVPKGLVYEMFRSTTAVSPLSDPREYDWHSDAVIHCRVYMYYLQFLYHQGQRRNAHGRAALDNLEWAAKHKLSQTAHEETNYNIIGHCRRSTGDTIRAYKAYKKSLEKKKYNNAVLWHLALLLRSKIRGEQ